MLQNILCDGVEMISYAIVGISQNRNPPRSQHTVSLLIRLFMLRGIMLRPIHFNDDLLFCYIKIYDIIFNVMLSPDVVRKSLQEIIPQMLFFRCHIFS